MARNKEEKNATKEELESIAESAGRHARKALEEGKHLAASGDNLVAAIREEPIKSSLIALGVGLVVGALLRGK